MKPWPSCLCRFSAASPQPLPTPQWSRGEPSHLGQGRASAGLPVLRPSSSSPSSSASLCSASPRSGRICSSLSPAVSIGISTSHVVNGGSFYNCLFYSLLELCGAALASCAFRLLRPSEYAKDGSLHALLVHDGPLRRV